MKVTSLTSTTNSRPSRPAESAFQVFLSSVTQSAINCPSRTIRHCAGVSTIEIFNIAGHGSTTRERQGACQCRLTVSRRKLRCAPAVEETSVKIVEVSLSCQRTTTTRRNLDQNTRAGEPMWEAQ